MSTNLTLDDFSADIIYSNNWAIQASSLDPNTDLFFNSTYHSAQADGASANITFSGSAIYLFGSKGPGHANYSVIYDNFVTFFSAVEEEMSYQQPLFGHTFTDSGTHFISFISHYNAADQWLDLDFVTITVNDASSEPASASASQTLPSASQTIPPPWLSELSTSDLPSVLPTSTMSSTASTSSSGSTARLTFILAIVFGAVIIAALALALGIFIARRKKGPRRDDQKSNQMSLLVEPGSSDSDRFPNKPALSLSPSVFGGPMSPSSAEVYSAHSPASRTDPFHRDTTPTLDHNTHTIPGIMRDADGRHSPYSTVSQGTGSQGAATMLTIGSTTGLLNPYSQQVVEQNNSKTQQKPIFESRTRRTLSSFRPKLEVPSSYKSHRAFESEPVNNPSNIIHPAAEKDVRQIPEPKPKTDMQSRPLPLPPLHAAHRSVSTLATAVSGPANAPQRPKRPAEGLLGWLNTGIAQSLERSATAKRRKNDGNSERTDFLKV